MQGVLYFWGESKSGSVLSDDTQLKNKMIFRKRNEDKADL